MTPAARIAAAIELLAAIEGAPSRPADAVASDFFRARRFIGSGDRRAVSARIWQVLRERRRLDWWLARIRAASTARLLVAASLLLEGWTADGVAQAFSGGQFAPDPLDAAERAVARALAGRTLDHPEMPEAVHLEVPDFLVSDLRVRFGDALVPELAALLAPAPLDLRTNLLKADRQTARAALAAEGLAAESTPLSPWGLRIATRAPVTAAEAFRTGLVEIQDEGSQLVSLLVDARPGQRVCDFCAGAAGKTLALAAMMDNRGTLVACDVNARRLEASVRRLRRAGAHNVERHLLLPGDKWAKRHARGFDRVLVDAPCSGSGTWRRNPDARLRLDETDVAELVVRQAAILDRAAPLVRSGGRLVYATCSLLAQENEDQVAAFLDRNPGFSSLPPRKVWALDLPGEGEHLRLSPLRHGTDGFFAAVLERRA
ncbi:MAG TPA: RsmB/NOP family class I SAM-dependent RNA methyltransferase [Acetobacteraceae bacterium]|nr:RsmB/NOP family class I SAM-dependent RNA methyltransferase [Acetobacteraceae bacterium]